jgi:8-oxo-dGTP diphosphatase
VRQSVRLVHNLVSDLVPGDDLEAAHRGETLRWLETTDDVYRRQAPMTPPRHLVSYILLVDDNSGAVLLVDHIKAGLWLARTLANSALCVGGLASISLLPILRCSTRIWAG